MKSKLPLISLIISIICLAGAVLSVTIGASKSQIYNQMKKAPPITRISEIKKIGDNPFLLSGNIPIFHKTITDNLVAYTTTTYEGEKLLKNPELTITLDDGSIQLVEGYELSGYNREICYKGTSFQGIKSGSDVTIYAVANSLDGELAAIGYQLYPGSPAQYINYLSSPYNAYMIYVRIFIALAVIFFIFSTFLNKKK